MDTIFCESCQKHVRTEDAASARLFECPRCGTMIELPDPVEPPSDEPPPKREGPSERQRIAADMRASREYKAELVRVLLRRGFERIATR